LAEDGDATGDGYIHPFTDGGCHVGGQVRMSRIRMFRIGTHICHIGLGKNHLR